MRTRPTILFFSPEACPVPALVRQWAQANAFPLVVFDQPAEVEAQTRGLTPSASGTSFGIVGGSLAISLRMAPNLCF